jgi:hypothetical protein
MIYLQSLNYQANQKKEYTRKVDEADLKKDKL